MDVKDVCIHTYLQRYISVHLLLYCSYNYILLLIIVDFMYVGPMLLFFNCFIVLWFIKSLLFEAVLHIEVM